MARRILVAASATLTVVWLFGCASTKLASERDPALAAAAYSGIVVEAGFRNPEAVRNCEATVQRQLRSRGYNCYAASELFFKWREYSQSEKDQVLDSLGVDGWLTITTTDQGYSSTYIPQTQTTTGSAMISGNTVQGSSRTTTSGGYNIYKPWASFEAFLRDTHTGDMVWHAAAETGGNAYASANTLIKSMSGKVATQLEKDGILRRQKAEN